MKFPITFNCGNCNEEHVSDFMAAFVLDTAGNWYFDLGEEKGWTGVNQRQYETLMDLLKQRTQLICNSCVGQIALDPESGRRGM
jgi:hypothetical protein